MLGYETLFLKITEIIIVKGPWYFWKEYWPIEIHNSMDVQVTECLKENQIHHSLKLK